MFSRVATSPSFVVFKQTAISVKFCFISVLPKPLLSKSCKTEILVKLIEVLHSRKEKTRTVHVINLTTLDSNIGLVHQPTN